MIDKNKVQKVIRDLLDHEAFDGLEHWFSPSQEFDTKLRQRGIVPNIEIYHKYKFPDGFDAESFQRIIIQLTYIYLFDSDRVMNPEKYIKNFYAKISVPEHIQQEYLSDLVKITGSLSTKEKECVVDYFLREQKQVVNRIKSFLPELKKLNPEIADINPQHIFDFYDLYLGLASFFHVDDIKYCLSLSAPDREKAGKELNKIKSILGVEPEFFMAPHRVQQLVQQFTKRTIA